MGKASKRKRQGLRQTEVKAAFDTSEVKNKPYLIHIFSGRTIGYLLLITVVCFAAYSNTFGTPFIWDDINMISENPVIQDLGNFTSSLKGYNYNSRRFIGYLTFALNYRVGGLNVAGYHIVNLLIHLVNAMLVYLFVILTFRTPFFVLRGDREKEEKERFPYKTVIALFSALLFVSHPLQTQAVTYIVQRFTSLAALFYLLSIVTYIKGRLLVIRNGQWTKIRKKAGSDLLSVPITYRLLPITSFFISFICAICAMKTKEIAFTLPMVVILYEFSFFKTPLKKKLLFLLPVLLTLIIIPLSIMNVDKPIGDILSDVSERTRLQTDIPRGDYIMTQMRVITTYIRLIFFPVNQNLDYDYPIYRSFLTPSVLLSFLFLLSIFGIGLYLFYASRLRSQAKDSIQNGQRMAHGGDLPYYRLIGFGTFWFFITLSVESSVIPIVDVIFEHRVYLPSMGAFIAITTSVFLLTERLKNRWHAIDRAVISVLAIIVMVLAGTTYARNIVWQDEVGFWEDVVSKSPAKSRTHYNLGVAYDSNGFSDNAIEHFIQTLQINPGYRQAHNNLGIAYLYQGKIAQAAKHIRTALKLEPDYPEAHNNLGLVLRSQGNIDLAIEHFMTALKLKPDYPAAHINLGVGYGTKGLTDKAIEHFRKSLEFNPGLPEAHNNLGVAFRSQGKIDQAIEHFRTYSNFTNKPGVSSGTQ